MSVLSPITEDQEESEEGEPLTIHQTQNEKAQKSSDEVRNGK